MCAVRIDFAGGWSDTPPVCYEHGGKVATLAIRWKDEVRQSCAACSRAGMFMCCGLTAFLLHSVMHTVFISRINTDVSTPREVLCFEGEPWEIILSHINCSL